MKNASADSSSAIKVGEFYELKTGSDVSDSAHYNEDIAPTQVKERTWNVWNVAALWVGMAICVPTYTLGGVLTAYFGLSVMEALMAILVANIIVLIPLTLNAFPGTKFGIPFPVLLRSSFGMVGSNIPCLIRAMVACGWFGIQTMFGGLAIHILLSHLLPGWESLGGTGEVIGFFTFLVLNLYIVIKGAESIKVLETLAAPLLLAVGIGLMMWPVRKSPMKHCSLSLPTVRKGLLSGDTSLPASLPWLVSGQPCRLIFLTSAAMCVHRKTRLPDRLSACR